jgi:hypothetical protein
MVGQCQDGVDGLIGSAFDEAAGVDQDHLGILGGIAHHPAGIGQPGGHNFGIHLVAGTAQALNVDVRHLFSPLIRGAAHI